MPKLFRYIWWKVRGVGPENYRIICQRCGRTGQAHWGIRGCWRFR